MTTDIARQWEAALAALDQDHEARLAWVAQHIPASCSLGVIRELNELYRLTYDAMHDYYYAGVWE